jgi:tetratricopeptide (TPR) repeat protein
MKGDDDRAIADASETIRLFPRYALAYGTRGEAYRMKGDFDRAVANLTEALRLTPGYEWAKNRLEMAKRRQR